MYGSFIKTTVKKKSLFLEGGDVMLEMMMEPRNCVDLRGRMFGQLLVMNDTGLDKYGVRKWACSCSCGRSGFKVEEPRLIEGFIDRCDACVLKYYATFNIPFDASVTSIHEALKNTCYGVWYNMCRRYLVYIRDPKNTPLKDRVAGISPQWKKFENFYKDMSPKKRGTELGRVDKDKEFSKENCRWMNRVESMKGRRMAEASLAAIGRPTAPTSYIAELKGAKTVPVVEKQASIIPLINHSQFKKELIVTMRADANAQIEAGSRMHHEAGKKIEEARALLQKLAEVEKALDLISSFKGAK